MLNGPNICFSCTSLNFIYTCPCSYFNRTKGKYGEGEKAEKFKYTLALVFVQCIINALAAKIGMVFIS